MRNLKIKTNKTDLKQIFRVKDKIIACDGGEDYGHPLIYLNLTKVANKFVHIVLKFLF